MYKAEVTAAGGYRFNAKTKDGQITIDAKSGAISPPDTLLASLGSCMGVYIRKYAEGSKLPLGDFTVTVEADLGREAPYRFAAISAVIDLKGAAIDDRRKAALIEFIKNCPVHNTLKASPEVTVRIA
jgi:uncharacterized OsmC-like protein